MHNCQYWQGTGHNLYNYNWTQAKNVSAKLLASRTSCKTSGNVWLALFNSPYLILRLYAFFYSVHINKTRLCKKSRIKESCSVSHSQDAQNIQYMLPEHWKLTNNTTLKWYMIAVSNQYGDYGKKKMNSNSTKIKQTPKPFLAIRVGWLKHTWSWHQIFYVLSEHLGM